MHQTFEQVDAAHLPAFEQYLHAVERWRIAAKPAQGRPRRHHARVSQPPGIERARTVTRRVAAGNRHAGDGHLVQHLPEQAPARLRQCQRRDRPILRRRVGR